MTYEKMKGILVLVGSFLIFLTLGALYTLGNFTTYITSYIRERSTPGTLRYTDSVWIQGVAVAFQGGFMFIGGLINLKISARITTLIGCLLISVGSFASYFTIQWSFYGLLLTYGIMFGMGIGTAYTPPLGLAMKWFPNNKGLVNGIALAGLGGGALVFDQVQFFYINPNNKVPDKPLLPGSDERYFSEELAGDVLDRVPSCFLLLGGCYLSLQIIGCLLLFSPPVEKNEEKQLIFAKKEHSYTAEKCENVSEVVGDVAPLAMLKMKAFYMLWFMFLLTGQDVVFISTLYKIFGQSFIRDDQFLSVVGSASAIFNATGRIVWGHLADRYSFRTALLVMTASLCALLLTFYSCTVGGRVMYFIWVCALFFTFSGSFSLYPTVTAKAFGSKYMTVNYGLVSTSQIFTGIGGAVLVTTLAELTTWFGMFSIMAAFAFIALFIGFFFDVRDSQGSHV